MTSQIAHVQRCADVLNATVDPDTQNAMIHAIAMMRTWAYVVSTGESDAIDEIINHVDAKHQDTIDALVDTLTFEHDQQWV